MVCSTPPSQKGSSRKTMKLSSQLARISRAPRWRYLPAASGVIRAPAWRRGAKDSGRQKPTRKRNMDAPTAIVM
jgi:hypothetical protein